MDVTSTTPRQVRAMVPNLEALIELRTVAREASAFLIGYEVGRSHAQMLTGRTRAPAAESAGER